VVRTMIVLVFTFFSTNVRVVVFMLMAVRMAVALAICMVVLMGMGMLVGMLVLALCHAKPLLALHKTGAAPPQEVLSCCRMLSTPAKPRSLWQETTGANGPVLGRMAAAESGGT